MTVHTPAPDSRRGGLATEDGRVYPLESVRVSGHAEAGLASTRLRQRFANPHDEALEVVYVLPLPADGAVLGYTIRIGERVIRGEVQPRETAEREYREALYQGRTAGLLEEDRADTFQQRLGNLPPRTPVDVEIDVLHPLAFIPVGDADAPRWEYRFPTVTGVRYLGAPGRVPDADRIDPARDVEGGIPTRVDLALIIVTDTDGVVPVSPSHDVRVVPGEHGCTVGFERAERLDRDIVVRWETGAAEVGVRVVEGVGLAGDDGRYALVTVTPPRAPRTAFARDLTVLLDASGSMQGAPLHHAKLVVEELLSSLAPDDRFEVLAFASKVRSLGRRAPGSDQRALGVTRRALTDLRAGGATEMQSAFRAALEPLRPDALRQVVLITDGYIGFEHDVVREVVLGLPRASRVHVVGVGAAPNRALTWVLARAGRGLELYAASETQALEAAHRLRAGTARPVVTGLSVSGSAVVAVAPARPHDVFAGQPVSLMVELKADGGTLVVEGDLAGSSEPFRHAVTMPARDADPTRATTLPIGARFGREAIADAELQSAGLPPGATFDLRIEALGMRHRITSRRTSLVALAEEPSVDPALPSRCERLAVEIPYGVSAAGVGLGFGPMALQMHMSVAATMSLPAGLVFQGGSYAREEAGDDDLAFSRVTMGAPTRDVPPPVVRPSRAPVDVIARVVRMEGERLTIEFEAPDDGWWSLHRAWVESVVLVEPARADDSSDREWRARAPESVTMDPQVHDVRGPVVAGTTVTYVVESPEGLTWRSVREFVLVCDAMPTRIRITMPGPAKGASV